MGNLLLTFCRLCLVKLHLKNHRILFKLFPSNFKELFEHLNNKTKLKYAKQGLLDVSINPRFRQKTAWTQSFVCLWLLTKSVKRTANSLKYYTITIPPLTLTS